MRFRYLLLVVVLLILGSTLLRSSNKEKEVSAALARALQAEDEKDIQKAVAEALSMMGDRAGIPEVEDEYLPVPEDASLLSKAEAMAAMQPHFSRVERQRFWRIGVDPSTLTAPLRAPASVMACMMAVHRAKLDGHEQALPIARDAAEFLLWAQEQAGAGCYPFPAARGTSSDRAMQVATRFLERAEAAGKLADTVRNGWAFEDHGDGGLQFDNGECGVAMFEYHELTRDERFLRSSKAAADWAMARPLCPNWNYNSFSVNLLAKAFQVTGEQKYLDAAWKKGTTRRPLDGRAQCPARLPLHHAQRTGPPRSRASSRQCRACASDTISEARPHRTEPRDSGAWNHEQGQAHGVPVAGERRVR